MKRILQVSAWCLLASCSSTSDAPDVPKTRSGALTAEAAGTSGATPGIPGDFTGVIRQSLPLTPEQEQASKRASESSRLRRGIQINPNPTVFK